jgi:hypothetical protein
MVRVKQIQRIDDTRGGVADLLDEAVAPHQQLQRHGRPEPVRWRVRVRLVMQQRPRTMRRRFDPLAAVVLLVDLQRELADLLADHRHSSPHRRQRQRLVDGDRLPRRCRVPRRSFRSGTRQGSRDPELRSRFSFLRLQKANGCPFRSDDQEAALLIHRRARRSRRGPMNHCRRHQRIDHPATLPSLRARARRPLKPSAAVRHRPSRPRSEHAR